MKPGLPRSQPNKWSLSVAELTEATGAQPTPGSNLNLQFGGVGSDTRTDLKGQLFVALKGDRYDAHDYLEQARASGAEAALVHRMPAAPVSGLSCFLVNDTLVALQQLATYWRARNDYTVVAITGSNGKTTSKEFTRALLEGERKTFASHGSFNNHWGVPFSLLSASEDDEIVIQEMGMNHKGELKHLCEIAKPDVVVCTMVGTAHIGELGSQQAVAAAKQEIYESSPQARGIFNLDNEFTRAMYDKFKNRLQGGPPITFSSFAEDVDVRLRAERFDYEGLMITGSIRGVTGSAAVPAFGRQNVVNLMAAASVGLSVGLTAQQIWELLPKCRTSWGRNQWLSHKSGARILFDAYNANPESMTALIKNLYELQTDQGRKILILGEMKELGAESFEAHRRLGELAASINPDVVWFLGEPKDAFSKGLKAAQFNKDLRLTDGFQQEQAVQIGSSLTAKDLVIIKGSRAVKLEQVIDCWDRMC